MDPISEIKQKLDIVDLVGGYVEIKKSGHNYKGICPFHGEKTPSLMVSPELQIFKCFGCGEAGDIFAFYRKIEGVEFGPALEALADRVGVKLEKKAYDPESSVKKMLFEINSLASQYFNYILTKHKVGTKALDYVKNTRRLTDETIQNFSIGYSPDVFDGLLKFLQTKKFTPEQVVLAGLATTGKRPNTYIDKFRGRIMFPLTGIDKKVIGFTSRSLDGSEPKYLNSPETLIFHKSSFIFGLDKAKVAIKHDGAIFVEGQMDLIAAHQAGISNVVASSGTSLSTIQLKILERYTKDITFAFDSDLAGVRAMHRAIELAEQQGFNIKVAMIPSGFKDLDELIQADPKKAKSIFRESIPAYDFFLVSALRRNNKNDPIGKRKIMDELTEIFRKMADPVLRDHYVKKISQEVGVSEAVVADLIKNTKGGEKIYDTKSQVVFSSRAVPSEVKTPPSLSVRRMPEEYILALILRAPLDTAQSVLYKLGQKDFTDPSLLQLFTELKRYLLGRKRKFEIQHFIKRFANDVQDKLNELYLWDLQETGEDEENLIKELEKVFYLLKKSTAKREMLEISQRIKQAELAGEKDLLSQLSREFKELSEKLL
ncbi:DNA primase [candidate division WWE3 bacterium]|nr:DNA primase [candidate division WWE3 bacterium]